MKHTVMTPEEAAQPWLMLRAAKSPGSPITLFKMPQEATWSRFKRLCLVPDAIFLQYSQVTVQIRKANCSEDALPTTSTPGHRNVIPVLRSSLHMEVVPACGKISVSYCFWFQFETCCIFMLGSGHWCICRYQCPRQWFPFTKVPKQGGNCGRARTKSSL